MCVYFDMEEIIKQAVYLQGAYDRDVYKRQVYARSELAAPQRFTVMETDDGYAVWDDICLLYTSRCV